jgi:hypothetical protein
MHPILRQELTSARIADFHRQAERDALVRAARRARRTGRHGRTYLPFHPMTFTAAFSPCSATAIPTRRRDGAAKLTPVTWPA